MQPRVDHRRIAQRRAIQLVFQNPATSLDRRAAEVVLDDLRASGVALLVISHQQWVIERPADEIADLGADHVAGA